jgi:hypothetical protein
MSRPSVEKKKKPSLFSISMDLYHETFIMIFLILADAISNRFKKHRDTANVRFDKLTQ